MNIHFYCIVFYMYMYNVSSQTPDGNVGSRNTVEMHELDDVSTDFIVAISGLC